MGLGEKTTGLAGKGTVLQVGMGTVWKGGVVRRVRQAWRVSERKGSVWSVRIVRQARRGTLSNDRARMGLGRKAGEARQGSEGKDKEGRVEVRSAGEDGKDVD